MYGLRRNGTIVTTNEDKRAELSKWKLFDNYENVESEQKTKIVQERERRIAAKEKEERERKEAIERAEIEKRNQIKRLTEEQNELRVELSKLTGMFSGKRRKEIQSRLTEVETTLAAMKSE